MADTPIDQAANLTSIRLKVPTGTVPVPPPGHLQLHAPDYDTLAVRRGDGSVVEIGGGGGGGVATLLVGPGGAIDAANTNPAIGLNVNAAPGTGIAFTGALLDQYARPYPFQALTLAGQSDPPAAPFAGNAVLWVDDVFTLHQRNPDGTAQRLRLAGPGNQRVTLSTNGVSALSGAGAALDLIGAEAHLSGTAGTVVVADDLVITLASGSLLVAGLPTADPHVDGALWIAPLTRQLMVSAG